ncbi:MAG: beta-propeller fold lactonase family protein, partial [bacterium]|nr:beta-propeller fold lactonase family protein [bacterium]
DGTLDFLERKGATSTTGLNGAGGVALPADGAQLYVAGAEDDALVVFTRGVDGRLTPFQVLSDDTGVLGLGGARSVLVAGSHVYVAGQSDDAVVVLSRDPADGTLTWLNKKQNGLDAVGLNGVVALALSADGEHLYIALPRPEVG